VPIDSSYGGVLIRQYADEGGLTLLDNSTGNPLWTAPDPGLSGQSASWRTSVGRRLTAVSGATGDRPFVLVYNSATGQQLGRYPSWLAGAGEDWVAVTLGASANKLTLEFIPLPAAG